MKVMSVALMLLLLLCGPLHAEMSVEEYLQRRGTSSHRFDSLWLYGMENGFSWANTTNEGKGLSPLYCVPRNLALTEEQVTSILDQYIRVGGAHLDTPIGLALRNAMQRAFPCSK